MARILIVDDHALVRAGIAAMLHSLDPGVLTAEAGRYDEAIELAGQSMASASPFDWVLLDLNLPDRSGFEALNGFREHFPELPVVVVSGQDDAATVLRALECGARSFLPKAAVPEQTRSALAALLSGEVFVPPDLAVPDRPGQSAASGRDFGALTLRQIDVLGLMVLGHSNKVIARRLDIAESTVKIHVSAILRELKVATRTQAMVEVARRRWRFPAAR